MQARHLNAQRLAVGEQIPADRQYGYTKVAGRDANAICTSFFKVSLEVWLRARLPLHYGKIPGHTDRANVAIGTARPDFHTAEALFLIQW